jgi:hypothetical protein
MKRNAEKGRSFPSSSHFALSLLVPAFALLFQTLFLGIFFFSSIRKLKKTQRKKNCREGKELSFKLPLYPLTFGSRLCLFVSNIFFWHLLLFK